MTFTGFVKNQYTGLNTGLYLLNFLKDIGTITTLYLDLSENMYIFSILKSFLSKYDNLKNMKTFILLMDRCKIIDSEMVHLSMLNTFNGLENCALSFSKNKLSSSSLPSFHLVS